MGNTGAKQVEEIKEPPINLIGADIKCGLCDQKAYYYCDFVQYFSKFSNPVQGCGKPICHKHAVSVAQMKHEIEQYDEGGESLDVKLLIDYTHPYLC